MPDINYLLFLQSVRNSINGVLDPFFLFVTALGESTILLLAISGIFWCVNKRAGSFLLLSCLFSNLVGQFLKALCCVYRPWLRSPELHPVPEAFKTATGFSFPSGHTLHAVGLWGGLAILLRKYAPLKWFFLILVLLVAFSRNWLGVHTPQDVLVGLLVGGIILWGMTHIMKMLDRIPQTDKFVLFFGLLASIALVVFGMNRQIPVRLGENGLPLIDPAGIFADIFKNTGFASGALLGWFLERRLIRMDETYGTWQTKLFRFLCGSFGLLILQLVFPRIFLLFFSRNVSAFSGMFLIGFFITAIYPLIIVYLPGGKRNN